MDSKLKKALTSSFLNRMKEDFGSIGSNLIDLLVSPNGPYEDNKEDDAISVINFTISCLCNRNQVIRDPIFLFTCAFEKHFDEKVFSSWIDNRTIEEICAYVCYFRFIKPSDFRKVLIKKKSHIKSGVLSTEDKSGTLTSFRMFHLHYLSLVQEGFTFDAHEKVEMGVNESAIKDVMSLIKECGIVRIDMFDGLTMSSKIGGKAKTKLMVCLLTAFINNNQIDPSLKPMLEALRMKYVNLYSTKYDYKGNKIMEIVNGTTTFGKILKYAKSFACQAVEISEDIFEAILIAGENTVEEAVSTIDDKTEDD